MSVVPLPLLMPVPLLVEFWRFSSLARRPKLSNVSKSIVKSPCSPQVKVVLAVAVVAVLFREVDDDRLERGLVETLVQLEVVELDCLVVSVLWLDTALEVNSELVTVKLGDARGRTVEVVTDFVPDGEVELSTLEGTPEDLSDVADDPASDVLEAEPEGLGDAVIPVLRDGRKVLGCVVPEDTEDTSDERTSPVVIESLAAVAEACLLSVVPVIVALEGVLESELPTRDDGAGPGVKVLLAAVREPVLEVTS